MTWSPARRTQRFVNRLVNRHAVLHPRRFGVTRVFAGLLRRFAHAGPRTIRVAVRVDLAIRGAARASALHAGAGERRARAVVATLRAPGARQSPATMQVQRLLARGMRIERIERIDSNPPAIARARRVSDAGQEITFPIARPVPRVFRRDVSSRAATQQVERPFVSMRATSNVALPSSSAFPPSEVDRLTDQVLRTIDRRLLAFRERHGRS